MFEQPQEPTGLGGALKLLGGLFLGIVAGILIPGIVFMVVSSMGPRTARAGLFVAEILDLGILAGIGYLTYQKIAHSMLARGLMIGISVAFLLNVICGMAMLVIR